MIESSVINQISLIDLAQIVYWQIVKDFSQGSRLKKN